MIEYSLVNTLQRQRANRIYYQVGGHKRDDDDESTDRSYSSDVRLVLFLTFLLVSNIYGRKPDVSERNRMQIWLS